MQGKFVTNEKAQRQVPELRVGWCILKKKSKSFPHYFFYSLYKLIHVSV